MRFVNPNSLGAFVEHGHTHFPSIYALCRTNHHFYGALKHLPVYTPGTLACRMSQHRIRVPRWSLNVPGQCDAAEANRAIEKLCGKHVSSEGRAAMHAMFAFLRFYLEHCDRICASVKCTYPPGVGWPRDLLWDYDDKAAQEDDDKAARGDDEKAWWGRYPRWAIDEFGPSPIF